MNKWLGGHGAFGFTQCRLENIMEELARWYDVDVILHESTSKKLSFLSLV